MISIINIYKAYRKFIKDKRRKPEVSEFILDSENLLSLLHHDIQSGKYRHGPYKSFIIYDPKRRQIDTAGVRDKIVHRLIYDYLVAWFDKIFYYHSYAARESKGLHRAVEKFSKEVRNTVVNNRNSHILSADIKKFFASVDVRLLRRFITRINPNNEYCKLIDEILFSFCEGKSGLPLGNITSQIFANIYLNELDRFVKHGLGIKHYFRYMDNIYIIHKDADYLKKVAHDLELFLRDELRLGLSEINISKAGQGTEYLGYRIFPWHRMIRNKTKKSIVRKLKEKSALASKGEIDIEKLRQSVASYTAFTSFASSHKFRSTVNEGILAKHDLCL